MNCVEEMRAFDRALHDWRGVCWRRYVGEKRLSSLFDKWNAQQALHDRLYEGLCFELFAVEEGR